MRHIDDRERQRAQIGIRTALLATCGIACFAACSRLLVETGVHIVLILIVMIPGAVGTFWGLAATKTGRRSALYGSLLGCGLCLVPSLIYLSLMATAGLSQGSTELTTMATLGLFSLSICLCLSGLVGMMFGISRWSSVA